MPNNLNKNFISWDSSNWERCLHYIDIYKNRSFEKKNVLEIGGANGSLSFWAANQNANVVCSDILPIDRYAFNKFGKLKNGSIRYEIIDALKIPYKDYFDFVIFKSVLGGIGRNNNLEAIFSVMTQIRKSLKHDGQCLFIENMKGTPIHHLIRNKYGAGKNGWYYPTINDFINLSKEFSSIQYKTFGLLGSTGKHHLPIRTRIDRKIDQLVPNHWNYIFAGIFSK